MCPGSAGVRQSPTEEAGSNSIRACRGFGAVREEDPAGAFWPHSRSVPRRLPTALIAGTVAAGGSMGAPAEMSFCKLPLLASVGLWQPHASQGSPRAVAFERGRCETGAKNGPECQNKSRSRLPTPRGKRNRKPRLRTLASIVPLNEVEAANSYRGGPPYGGGSRGAMTFCTPRFMARNLARRVTLLSPRISAARFWFPPALRMAPRIRRRSNCSRARR